MMAAVALGMATLCAGCPMLAIPSLAYQGYKYEHDKKKTPATSSGQSSTKHKSATKPSSSSGPNDSNIE
jgi:hypothetical protein